MILRFVEVTDRLAYGKFLVARLDDIDLGTESAMPEAPPRQSLFNYAGRRRFNNHSTLVVDLQRGTGFAWTLQGGERGMVHYVDEHLKGMLMLVCPLYVPFVAWLHQDGRWAMGNGDIEDIPRYLELPVGGSE